MLCISLLVFPAIETWPQTSADFSGPSGGSVILGTDSRSCDSSIEGGIRYNTSTNCAEFCNGSSWTCPDSSGGGSGPAIGYFVRTSGTYNGNRGGLTGANAECLSHLQAQNWKGKASAGTLNSARVKAWLCDSSTCNNLQPTSTYIFAVAGNTSMGGAAFVTDSGGSAPGFSEGWATNAYIGSSLSYWTGRANGSASLWSTSSSSNTCTDWTLGLGGGGSYGTAGSTSGTSRWNQGAGNCAATFYMICFVDPE